MLLAVWHRIDHQRQQGIRSSGQYAQAQKASDDAKKWAIWGAIAGVIVIVIYLIVGVAGGGLANM